jgi:hypothetical protein
MSMSFMARSRPAALKAAALVSVAATLLACTRPPNPPPRTTSTTVPPNPDGTLRRPADPVVLTGSQVGALAGIAPGQLVAFRAGTGTGGWVQIPVQVDERVALRMYQVYGLAASTRFGAYPASPDIPVTVYADPGTFVGPDTDPALDADDEIALMARDAGGTGRAGALAQPPGTVGRGVEVKITDPIDPGATGYVYLFRGDGSLDPGAGQRYVDYAFKLDSGDYKTTYQRLNGPNPEDSTVTGATYTTHFADRWLEDSITLTRGDRPTTDLIDRVKYDINLVCSRNENTFDAEEGAFVVNRSGPVRALRGYVGSNSGPNTQNTHAFYDQAIYTSNDLRVHGIPNVGSHLDLNQSAVGMTFRNPYVPNGVAVDGRADNVPTGQPSWWTYSGPQGGLAMSVVVDTNATAAPQTSYEDSTNASANAQCTGDTQAIGDAGVRFASWISCTDPGMACQYHLHSVSRWVATPAATTPAELQRIGEQGLKPLTVTTSSY